MHGPPVHVGDLRPGGSEERPDIALCRLSTAVVRAAEAQSEVSGVGVGQHLVLKMLAAVGPCSQQALSEELRIDRSVMVGLADDLEKAGHVTRTRNPIDRRAYEVVITETGSGCWRTRSRTRPPDQPAGQAPAPTLTRKGAPR
ncbi:MarR family winged helix-turn-helix transcriptional regulator [Actinosynnema sp. NPDC047251]|uniref:HTH marR-type domain-containing protein n=1 Tax=Saccharothrix espanaensis (strain ATCC 51144 / DSM 44229 / JCM 9112 / NBRC 15066 / NRRL 15764) TaxID=1179773 RepID=K0JQ25_SACES|nr:MarR family winged helix-turn-helix transcriptional regulator [Saccharothrix espanaensis]CCH27601.1 hypothetical protein BN6_02680 [Saccharothrix espanaensis DSM 44229]